MNTNYNNLYSDYIGAIGTYSITDYIDITSNNLNNNINITSNILNSNINITSNILNNNIDILTANTYHININNSNCLINTSNTLDYLNGGLSNINNIYIKNNYEYGEIRFKVKNENEYLTKIGRNGKLYIYIRYNALRPTISANWYEVNDILHEYMFNTIIWNGALAGYGADLIYIGEQINIIDAGIEAIDLQIGGIIGTLQVHTKQINELIALQPESLVSSYLDSELLNPAEIVNNITYNGINAVSRTNSAITSLQNLGGLGLLGWVISGTTGFISLLIEKENEYQKRQLNIYATLITNSNISNLDIPDPEMPSITYKNKLLSNISSNLEISYSNQNIYISNLNVSLGFINSNITTQQYIPSLKTSLLDLNYANINNVNTINATTGIYSSISTTNSENVAIPSVGNLGGIGDKIIISNGTPTSYPYSIGRENNALWISSPSNINFYISGSNVLSLSSNYTTSNKDLICYGNIKENNNYLSNIYPTSNIAKNLIVYDTPNVNKKFAFYCQTTNIIYPNNGNTAYYAYHLDLRNYTKTGYIDIGSGSGDTYRIFKIKCFFGSSYFQKLTNGIPDICDYTIYMSNKAAAGGDGTIAGINIMATGIPQNYFLNNLMNNNLFLLRNTTTNISFNFNYLSIISKSQADVRVFIEDLLS